MAAPSTWSSFTQFASNAAVVIVGWVIVHQLSRSRDQDKARRELVAKTADNLVSELTGLFNDARTYHVNPRNLNSENAIKMSIQDIAQSISGLKEVAKNHKVELSMCQSAVRAVRVAITGAHFEDEHVEPLSEEDALLQTIAAEVLRAKRTLSNLKHRQFT